MKITIDTCLINANQNVGEMNSLEHFAKKGLIQIVGTDRLLQETDNNELRSRKAEFFENIAEPFTVGKSRIGKAYISDGSGPSFNQISSILFPNKSELSENESNDVMHLISHANSDSEYFVTNNKWDFIHDRRTNLNRDGSYKNHKRNELRKFGINVVLPGEMLEIVKELEK